MAADADVGIVIDDAGETIFGVGLDGAAEHAGGLDAMVAAHGEVPALGEGEDAAFDFTDATPVDFGGVAVLFVAGDDAAFAADTFFDVEVKAVLFAGFGKTVRGEGDACASGDDGQEVRAAKNWKFSG